MELTKKWEDVSLLDMVVTFKNDKDYFTVLKALDNKVLTRNSKNEFIEMDRDTARKEWIKFKNNFPTKWLKSYMKKTHKFKEGQIITGKNLNGYKDFNIIHSTTYVDNVYECEVKGIAMYLKYNNDQGITTTANQKYKVIEIDAEYFSIKPVE